MNRREFTVEAALMLLGGATISISGCGGGSGGATANPAAASIPLTDAQGTIASNHGHAAVVTAAQLGAGGGLELDIRGTSSHGHMLALSAGEVATIRGGGRVEKESAGSSHTHTVVFNG
jgi:hypothetical protein